MLTVERDTEQAMSEANIETTRAAFAAYSRGDFNEVLESWAPDALLDWTNSHGFDSGVYRGHGEIRAFWERFFAMFEKVRVEIVDLRDVGDGLLIAENVAYLRGRDGIEVEARSTFLIRRRDGLTTSLTLYQSRQEALEAAGLSASNDCSAISGRGSVSS
jgi:ketosteroid isomerase-like protein